MNRTLVTLDGLDSQTLEQTDTRPAAGGGRPFPCDSNGWTRHTATVTKADLKVWEDGKESIEVYIQNGAHAGSLLVDLDPRTAPDPQKALDTRNKLIKVLGAHTDGQLDLGKLKKASGQIVEIIAKHKGFTTAANGNTYHKVSLIFTGSAEKLEPVQGTLPPLPGAEPADDIAF